MPNLGTYRHINAALLAAVVFLAGIWAGLKFARPTDARGTPEVARTDAPPRAHPPSTPVEATGVSHGARASWSLRAPSERAWQSAPVAPALNMRETPAGYDITVSLSGVHPRDLNIRTERSLLIIQADLKNPDTGQSVSTEGRLRIPSDARLDAMNAAFSNNNLHISIPRGKRD